MHCFITLQSALQRFVVQQKKKTQKVQETKPNYKEAQLHARMCE